MAGSLQGDAGVGAQCASPVDLVRAICEYLARRSEGHAARGAAAIEHVETHLSHVFLCGDVVYKLLKPVRFAFVDFSTIERRREECRAEVEANQPLAGDIYVAAEPVVRMADGRVAIVSAGGGEAELAGGETIDWVVRMRRLPADRTLETLVRRSQATEQHIASLAMALSRFYAEAPRSSIAADEYVTAVDRHVRENFAELSRPEHALPRCLVNRVRAAQLTTLALSAAWFRERAASGRIVLGHGDLRCEHVYFTPNPVAIDALAFSRDLRTLDAADEVAFLSMELRRLDAHALADALIRAYQMQHGDEPPPGLWSFYQAYRACVRAKVAVLRGLQLSESERAAEMAVAREYLELADRLSRPLLRPLCVVVRGLSGTGKSTLAAAIAEKLGIVHLQTDRVRRQLFPSAGPAAYGQGHYTSAARQMVYDAMFAQARELLGQGMPVVLDGTFLSAACRLAVATTVGRAGAKSIVLACCCPVEFALERLHARAEAGSTESDATEATLRRQAIEAEADPPLMPSTSVDTTRPLEDQVDVAIAALSAALNGDAV